MRLPAAGHRARRGGASGEEGITLIELLIAVMMLGLAAVGIMAGIASSFRVAEYHRKTSTAETVLRAYTEVLKEPKAVPYIACSSAAVLQPTTPIALPLNTYAEYLQQQVYDDLEEGQRRYRVEISKIEVMTGNSATAGPVWGTCGPGTDKGAQRITLVVKAAIGEGQAVERVTIVKRDGTQDIAPTTSTTTPPSTTSTTTP